MNFEEFELPEFGNLRPWLQHRISNIEDLGFSIGYRISKILALAPEIEIEDPRSGNEDPGFSIGDGISKTWALASDVGNRRSK